MTKPPSTDQSDKPVTGGFGDEGADERSFFADQPPERPLHGKRQGATSDKDSSHVHGHRDRLRARFRDNGANALADYEILELLLFRLIPGATPNRSPRR
nr:hypothetical protein [Marinicella sp. W31]MDC2876977.1 hypothetical protein [Marinicella sp. W31]